MIADWTVEVGPDSPQIVVPWEGWVDPRAGVEVLGWADETLAVLDELPEVRHYPELAQLLAMTNRLNCLTSKVDVFLITREEVDPEIAELGLEQTAHGLASYLDVLTVRPDVFPEFADFELLASKVAGLLNGMDTLPAGMAVEIVVRPARLYDQETFGWTLYAMGFGRTKQEARGSWSQAFKLAVCCLGLQIASAVIDCCKQRGVGKKPQEMGE